MIIVDAHEDIAFNALQYGRDYRLSTYEKRRLEADMTDGRGRVMLGLPDALAGRVAIAVGTLFVEPASHRMTGAGKTTVYRTPKEAYTQALAQMDYYQRLGDTNDRMRLVRTLAELDSVLATWGEGSADTDHVQGLIISMENADPIVEPRQFEEWYGRGVRAVGPAWAGTRYCGGTGQPGPLTALGHELLDVMMSFNVLLDLSHMAEAAYFEAVDRYDGAIIASHSNPRAFRDSDRHLSDVMIRRLAERDGVIGVVLFNHFLSENWSKGLPKDRVPLSIVLDVIDYICQLTGSIAHVGIGSDFDGGFGADQTPEELETVGDLGRIGEGLRTRGYSQADIEAVMGGNMLRKLRQVLPSA